MPKIFGWAMFEADPLIWFGRVCCCGRVLLKALGLWTEGLGERLGVLRLLVKENILNGLSTLEFEAHEGVVGAPSQSQKEATGVRLRRQKQMLLGEID